MWRRDRRHSAKLTIANPPEGRSRFATRTFSPTRYTRQDALKRALIAGIAAAIISFSAFAAVLAKSWGAGVWNTSGVGCLNNNFNSECTADNEAHTVYIFSNVDDTFTSWIEDSLEEDFLLPNAQFSASRVSTLTSTTDAYVIDAEIPGSIPTWIYTTCGSNSTHGGGNGEYEWCEPHAFRHDSGRSDSSSCMSNQNCMRRLACHELGHTTGLQHPGASPDATSPDRETCMEYQDGSSNPHSLDAHDEEHLIDCYPRPSPYPAVRTLTCRKDGV